MRSDTPNQTRREFLRHATKAGVAGIAATTFVTRITSAQTQGLARDTRIGDAVVADDSAAPVISSINGRLKTVLKVVRAPNKIGSAEVELRSYNGRLVGPTLRVRPGDTLEIRLENELPWSEQAAAGHSGHHDGHFGYNATNLHTHGLHVSPIRPADDVLIAILPKGAPASAASGDTFVGSFDYKFEISPSHLPGTHWYHAHLHGATAIQLASGMAGTLIVEGDIDEVPEIRAARERILLFQQIPFAERSGAPGVIEDTMLDDLISRFNGQADAEGRKRFTTINGTLPVVRLKKGQVERWRLIHGGIFETLPIDVVSCNGNYTSGAASLKAFCSDAETATSSDGIAFYPIARDGITLGTLEEVRGAALPMLGPGNRMDVLVKPLREGTYVLRKRKDESLLVALNTSMRFPGVSEVATPAESAAQLGRDAPYALAIIVVEPGDTEMALPSAATMQGLKIPRAVDPAVAPTVAHEIRFRRRGDKGYVGDRTFEPRQFPRTLVEGRTERWLVWGQREAHPFHIHVNPFLQIENNGTPLARPVWLDTVFLGNGQTATLLMRYDDFVGRFVLHCHNLVHEDIGMMELVEIVPKPQGTLAGIQYFQFDTAPTGDFKLEGPAGASISRSTFAGRMVILHLWSPGCTDCAPELRDLAALKAKMTGTPFDVAAVAVGADAVAGQRFLSQNAIAGLTAYGDRQSQLTAQFNVAQPPASLLIDRDGHARAILRSRVEWLRPEATRLVRFFAGVNS